MQNVFFLIHIRYFGQSVDRMKRECYYTNIKLTKTVGIKIVKIKFYVFNHNIRVFHKTRESFGNAD